ncbi:phospholipid/cholesterol/gamma-HCH transport system substrate-binding protein [Marmoricola sp. OAE513]|uniref:MCE family protein n=1 Tax=Marmoricola sp. OAE513 TaxID=2817894 RepID=UPI001AE28E15
MDVRRTLELMSGRLAAGLVALLVVLTGLTVFVGGDDERTVTAHFSRAVALYKGSEVRLMGVPIGTITSVTPEGDSVRVVMTYDARYKLPATARAAIITPTLVSDRFVQLAPAYTSGPELADHADIPLDRSGTPVELDRIYRSLADLSSALGPNGANKNGALASLITSGAHALGGNGALANQTLRSMSEAVQAFGDNSGALFSSVRQLSELTGALARNDDVVNSFVANLAGVSADLAGERDDLRRALVSLAQVVKEVRGFVRDNRASLTSNIKGLSRVLGAVASESDALGTALQLAPLGLGNLALAYDPSTGSIGSRMQLGPTGSSLGNILCDVVANARIPNSQLACSLLKKLVGPLSGSTDIGAGRHQAARVGAARPSTDLGQLLGAAS